MARPKKAVDVGVSAIVTNKGENCVELRLRTAFGLERAFALPLDLARTMANMTMGCVGFVEQTLEVSQLILGDGHGEQKRNDDRAAEPCGNAKREQRGRNVDSVRSPRSPSDQDAGTPDAA